jgi:hypothetical protein
MNFKSTGYDWLVVSESEARLKGSGTINGSGKYGFILIVADGVKSSGKARKFRMKIWDKTTGKTVYDNNLGYPEDIAPTTEISDGKVDINSKH